MAMRDHGAGGRGAGAPEPGVERIAVLRANALGDFLFALPALDALRRAYPSAEIVLLGRDWHASFLDGRPSPVDRAVPVPPYDGVCHAGGSEDPDRVDAFFASMERERFDLAFQLHGGGRNSNPFVQRLGARLTVGTRTPDAVALDRWIPYVYYQHETIRLLEVVALAGAHPVTLEPVLAVTPADMAEADAVLPDAGALVALHPGATDPRRRWPPEKFAAVGDALGAAGADVVVTGTGDEAGLVRDVVGAMDVEAADLAGALGTGGLAALLSRCHVVVSNDTGPLHLAAAVGAATVGIYWCGNMINAGPLTRARHRPAIAWRLACPVCGVDCTTASCPHRQSFVADVPVDEVRASALDLLAGRA